MRTGMMPANQQQQMMMRNGMGMPNGRGPIMYVFAATHCRVANKSGTHNNWLCNAA